MLQSKMERQSLIKCIVKKNKVKTLPELRNHLSKEKSDYSRIAISTLSRDIRDCRINVLNSFFALPEKECEIDTFRSLNLLVHWHTSKKCHGLKSRKNTLVLEVNDGYESLVGKLVSKAFEKELISVTMGFSCIEINCRRTSGAELIKNVLNGYRLTRDSELFEKTIYDVLDTLESINTARTSSKFDESNSDPRNYEEE